MGLDIYKLKVRKKEDKSDVIPSRWRTLIVSDDDLKENKSLSDVFNKFKDFVEKSQAEYYDIKNTALKFSIPDTWYYSGIRTSSNGIEVMVFSDENDVHMREIPLTDALEIIGNCYTLYSEEIGYQRKDCNGPMFDEFFGGQEFYGIHYTPYNEVLEVAKTYTNPDSPMESWTLNDDEFIDFSF